MVVLGGMRNFCSKRWDRRNRGVTFEIRGLKKFFLYIYIYIYINNIIYCKIKKDNHQVPKIIRVPGNKKNPKKRK